MNLTKCPNGHLYDGSKCTECPYCLQEKMDARTAEMMETCEEKKEGMEKAAENCNTYSFSMQDDYSQNLLAKSFYEKIIGVQPVVGWLVCTQGEYFGESFKLVSGKNFIGRASDMDIILGMDRAVSRNRHACVIYTPKSRCFIAQPGEAGALFYLNDKQVLSNVKMQAYDTLLIGTTRLMLVPCCNEQFSCDDNLKKK